MGVAISEAFVQHGQNMQNAYRQPIWTIAPEATVEV